MIRNGLLSDGSLGMISGLDASRDFASSYCLMALPKDMLITTIFDLLVPAFVIRLYPIMYSKD